MMHKVQVIYEVEVEGNPSDDPKDIAAAARSIIETTDHGNNCSFVRVMANQKELKNARFNYETTRIP